MAKTILIVEDATDTRRLMATMLEKRDYKVFQAGDGYEALQIAKQKHPNLIIMDMSMPMMDGVNATRLLKSSDETKDIPIIALTAFSNFYEERAEDAGVNEFLTKPIDPPALLEAISRYFGESGLEH